MTANAMSDSTPSSSDPGRPAPNLPPTGGPVSPNDPARSWNVACHLAALTGLVTVVGFILGPLIVWLLKKADYPSVDHHGKEAVNFQLSVLLYSFGLGVTSAFTCGLTVPLLLVLVVAQVVLVVVASIKVGNGEDYRYPLTLRLIK